MSSFAEVLNEKYVAPLIVALIIGLFTWVFTISGDITRVREAVKAHNERPWHIEAEPMVADFREVLIRTEAALLALKEKQDSQYGEIRKELEYIRAKVDAIR